ncbi:MAG TPA: hypothetical protein DCX53_16975 [Anaerolineae bacterium]|nr:hypothetical protein [Anaerolineae bacterium]
MLKTRSALTAFVVLLIASLACAQPAAPVAAPDQNAVNTSIVQTIGARQTEIALNNPAAATFTPVTPTLTLEPTLSATPDYTPTSTTPMISVSVDTNCRVGPGAIFERVGILLVGETAEIVGREPKGEYWYIRNPDQGDDFCWVWGEYATVTGNTLPLLFLSPPPPPNTSFSAAFDKIGVCAVWWADFKLVNNSGALFKSISITLTDTNTDPDTVVSQTANGFTLNNACASPVKTDTLIAGGNITVSSPSLPYNPAGHTINAKIKVCLENDQKGTCVMQEINFKP